MSIVNYVHLYMRKCQYFGGATVSVTVRIKSSYEHLSNSKWLPRYRRLNLLTNSVRFLFVGLDEERSFKKKDGYTRRIDSSHFGICGLHKET